MRDIREAIGTIERVDKDSVSLDPLKFEEINSIESNDKDNRGLK